MSSPDHQNPIRIANDALQAALSSQRFQAVVERIRRQVKTPKGEKKSKWVDTEKFAFNLFPGAQLHLPKDQAAKLAIELNNIVAQLLADWRDQPRKRISALAAQPVSLSSAKIMQECLQTINHIDALGYVAVQIGGTDADWLVQTLGSEGVTLVGDDKAMTTLFNDANRALAALTNDYREAVTQRLREAVEAIP